MNMSIKIKGSPSKFARATEKKPSNAGGKSKAAPSTGSSNSDSIDLTGTAGKLQQIEQSLADIPIVDSSRVDAITQSINDGQYHIDNEQIADRIIESENEVNKKK